jgi:NADP-reducing hydrogenase subunit HndD
LATDICYLVETGESGEREMDAKDSVHITINGVHLTGEKGMTILELAVQNDIVIPTLCHRPELSLSGSCRLCVVEVEGSRTLVGSCHTPITEGMVIHTDSPRVMEARFVIVELLLSTHAGNCFLCDKANLCELRKLAAELEVGISRLKVRKRYYPVEDVSPYIERDLSKCILCRRCVRACNEITEEHAGVFSIAYRGFDSKVIFGMDQPVDSEVCRDCDVCISLCPTGALRRKRVPGVRKSGTALFITT